MATISAHWDKTIETPIVLVTHVPLLTSFFQATEGHEPAAPLGMKCCGVSANRLPIETGCSFVASLGLRCLGGGNSIAAAGVVF